VAEGIFQKLNLVISCMPTFSLYPATNNISLSEFKYTIKSFRKSRLSLSMSEDNQDLCSHTGGYIAIHVWKHVYFSSLQGDNKLLQGPFTTYAIHFAVKRCCQVLITGSSKWAELYLGLVVVFIYFFSNINTSKYLSYV